MQAEMKNDGSVLGKVLFDERMKLFDGTFQVRWGLKLRVIVCGLVKGKKRDTREWYDNRCSVSVILFSETQELILSVHPVKSVWHNEAKDILDFSSYLVPAWGKLTRPYDWECDSAQTKTDLEDALMAAARAIKEDEVVRGYHHFACGGMA